jgi:hypothetical protein
VDDQQRHMPDDQRYRHDHPVRTADNGGRWFRSAALFDYFHACRKYALDRGGRMDGYRRICDGDDTV